MIKQYKYGEVLRTQYIKRITTDEEVEILASDMASNEEISTDYSGREILEFVQNMADAANKSGKDCCGLIKLVGSNIIVCNQGTPFNDKGIRSVHHAYQSTKKHENASIGNKGLGFRGVLNLADSVEIYSGEFAIKFSKQIAKQELEKIKNNSQIQKTIKEFGEETSISMFAVPMDIDFPENTTKNGKFKIDNVEYDTYIKIHIEDDEKTKKFIDQIDKFIKSSSDSLLFLNHLNSLTLAYPNNKLQDVITTISVKEKETVSTTPNIKLYELNKTNSEKAELYYMCVKNDLTIAIPSEISNNYYEPYVFFPVKKEPDSFPVILHAKNFKITSNRNNFADQNRENIDIARCLFDFLLEISCFFANTKYGDLSLKMVKFLTSLNSPFKENENYFYEKLCSCSIIPTIKSSYKSINDVLKRYPDIFSKYINIFKNEDNIVSVDTYNKIPDILKPKVSELSVEKMYIKINEVSDTLDTDTRAKLFFDWKKFAKEKSCNSLMPKILKYTNGDFFTYDSSEHGKISMLATDKDIKEIPNWAKNPILCQKDREALYDNIDKLNPTYSTMEHKDRLIEKDFSEDFEGAKDINTFLDSFMNKLINNDYNKAVDFVVFLIKNRDIADRLNKNETKLNLPDNEGNVFTADNLYFGTSYNQHNENICNLFEMKEFISFDKIKPHIDSRVTQEDIVNLFYKYYFVNKTPNKILYENIQASSGYINYLQKSLREKEGFSNTNDFHITQISVPFIKKLSIALNNVKTKKDTECILSWINNEESIRNHITHNREIKIGVRYNRTRSDVYETLYDKDNYDKYLLYTTKWLIIDDNNKCAPRELLLKNDIPGIIKSSIDIFGETYKKLFSEIGVKENIYETDADIFYKALLLLPTTDKDGLISRRIYANMWGENTKKYVPITTLSCPEKKDFFNNGKLFAKRSEKEKGEFRPVSEVKFASRKTLNLSNQWLIDKQIRTGNAKEFKSIFNIDEVQDNINITRVTVHPKQSDFVETWNDFKPFVEIYASTNTNIQKKLPSLKITIISSAESDGKIIEKDIPDYYVLPGKNDTEWYIYLSEDKDSLNRENLGENLGEIFNIIANSARSVKPEIELLFLRSEEDRLNKLEDFGCDISSFNTPKSMKDSFVEALKKYVPDFDSDSLDCDIFNNLESFVSQKQIMDILIDNNLTFKDIKNNGFTRDIDFSSYHKSIIKNKLSKIQYELQLYNDTKDNSDSEIKKQFFDNVENFDKKLQNISVNESDIECNYDEYCTNLNPYYNQKTPLKPETNITDIFHQNKEKFIETYKDFSADDLSNLSNEEKSMVLFELFEDLKVSIENRIHNQQNTNQNQSNQQKTFKIVVDDTFVAKKPHQIVNGHTKNNARKESGEKLAKEKAKKGEEAEEIVYNSFNKDDDYTEVDWVSSTGYKKGKGTRNNDSLGYDISYKFKSENKTYYAEVKSVSKRGNQYEFLVSANEKSFADTHPDSFVFALVLPNDEIRILKDVSGIFKEAITETYRCATELPDDTNE